MHQFSDTKILPYSAKQMFDLVADVGRYPEFLPWCNGARLYNWRPGQFDADVIIGFQMFRETFTSRVTLQEAVSVDVDYIKGPMRRLFNHWRFTDTEQGCTVNFHVELEFKNRMLEKMIGKVFTEATERMVDAFETRAHELYG